MAAGDITLFNEFAENMGKEVFNFSSDTIKAGIITNAVTPTAADSTPTWSDYSANQVATGTSYTGPVTITTNWTRSGATSELTGVSFTLTKDAGSGFNNGYWLIIFDDTEASDAAIAFMELGGPVDLSALDVNIKFNNAAVGVAGRIFSGAAA